MLEMIIIEDSIVVMARNLPRVLLYSGNFWW